MSEKQSGERLRVAVIVGSTRAGRFGPTVANWFVARARRRAELEIDLIDLAEAALPQTLTDTDEPPPAPVAALAPRLAGADAFVVVTPEYNRSFPAPLKSAVDWFYREWQAKPVAFVSYGNDSGGLFAAAQLRQVFTEVHAVAVHAGVTLPRYWEQFAADGGWPRAGTEYDTAATTTLDQLTWWARALRDARAGHPYPC
ncbi:NADPH-dependent FMN reductase [Streptosporangium sp. NPDC050855]|uniref:NADPH-dependent FMN reductase n=1 Tax=Streptosporangium sp. NPDC050855 TaxID=3366194 RepID=UPI00379A849D